MIGFHWGTGAVVADLRRQLKEARDDLEAGQALVYMAGREIARMQAERDEARAERRRAERLWQDEVSAHEATAKQVVDLTGQFNRQTETNAELRKKIESLTRSGQ